jgi:hypothetical protein
MAKKRCPMTRVAVSDIRFTGASDALRARGVHGWVCCGYGDLRLDGLRIRRHEDGSYSLGFPSHIDGNGVAHAYYRPLDHAARISIETQVLGDLRRRGILPRGIPTPHSATTLTSREESRP